MTPDLLNSADIGGYSTDPSRPDYACPTYVAMAPRWSLVSDVREGTLTLRAKRAKYLPRFEAETPQDWDTRIAMTFATDHYATTLTEHVGLVMACPIKLQDDVPVPIRELTEDIDGEGNHLDVFTQTALHAALDLGHAVLFTDYPQTDNITSLADERRANARPYVTLYKASDVLRWEHATVGGVKVLVRVAFRESESEAWGIFGVKECVRVREFQQAVYRDELTGRATGLGPITWQLWKEEETKGDNGTITTNLIPVGTGGTMVGPTQIPARVVYGGEKIGLLNTIPHLYGLALSVIEHTQVASDYASVMHKCNVPTPVFIGRNVSAGDGTKQTLQMGQGIDIPVGGSAMMLEPSGAAIDATRLRLQDLEAQMRRQGATMDDATTTTKTAAEARLYAKQRNAKLARAARSLQDAIEGVLADMAAFMKIPSTGAVKSGGSVVVNQDFAGEGIDSPYLTVLLQAYQAGALPLDAFMYALEKGRLPEDFQSEDAALRLLSDEMARQDAAATEQARLAAQPPVVTPPTDVKVAA